MNFKSFDSLTLTGLKENNWEFIFSASQLFSANFAKIAVKCKQTAEKTNLLDFCDPYGCGHWFQY